MHSKKEMKVVKLLQVIFVIWIGILFGFSLSHTGYNLLPGFEGIEIVSEPVLINIGLFLLFLAGSMLLGGFYDRWMKTIPMVFWLIIACVIVGTISLCWLRVTLPVPESDQLAVFNCAKEYLQGATWMFERGGYMSIYQNNLGLMTIHILLIKLFGENAFVQYQILVALSVPILVLAGYKITGFLSDKRKSQFLYLVYTVFCVPMYCYVTFVYNDLLSTVLVMVSTWCFLSCSKQFKVYKVIILGLLVGLTVALRTNTVIVAIAFLLILMVRLGKNNKKQILTMVFSVLAGILLIHFLLVTAYRIPKDADSVPAMAYINMGLHDGNIGPGWYDGSSLAMFTECNFDAKMTTAKAKEEICAQMEQYRKESGSLADFLKRKMLTQWHAPMYQCFAMSRQYKETAKEWVVGLYARNDLAILLEHFMKGYQLLVYGGVFLFMLLQVFKRKYMDTENYALLLGVFGGFLFSLLWEAKTRYVFPYFLMMIPYLSSLSIGFKKSKQKVEA